MKLDHDYIIKILRIVEDHEKPSISHADLQHAIGDDELSKLNYHLNRIEEAKFLKSFLSNVGVGVELPFIKSNYTLTWKGHQHLDKK